MLATLTPGGWVFLLTSTVSMTGLVVWCFWRVLTLPPEDVHGGPPVGLGP